MRKLFCFILALAISVSMFGCTKTKNQSVLEEGALKVGVTIYDPYDTFLSEVVSSFDKYLKELGAVENISFTVLRENADNSQTLQNTQVRDFINSACDIICVNLVDRTDASNIIDMAEAANIPVIFFNRELVEEDIERWDGLYYVGAPAIESGILQGQIVSDICKKDFDSVDLNGDGIIQYVMLEGEADHQDAVVRTEFSIKTIESDGFPLERLETGIANWSRPQAESKMTQWLEAHGVHIELVLANNDDMALGAIDALKKADLGDKYWPVIVGIDGTIPGKRAIQDGELSGTVINDSFGQAKGMAELLCMIKFNIPLSEDIILTDGKYIRLPYKKLTLENIDDY